MAAGPVVRGLSRALVSAGGADIRVETAVELEDVLLRVLCEHRRQQAEAELHRIKGEARCCLFAALTWHATSHVRMTTRPKW